MPFKLMGKSPLMKKLVGNQHRLPEKLKEFIKAAPTKLKTNSKKFGPLKNKDDDKKDQSFRNYAREEGEAAGYKTTSAYDPSDVDKFFDSGEGASSAAAVAEGAKMGDNTIVNKNEDKGENGKKDEKKDESKEKPKKRLPIDALQDRLTKNIDRRSRKADIRKQTRTAKRSLKEEGLGGEVSKLGINPNTGKSFTSAKQKQDFINNRSDKKKSNTGTSKQKEDKKKENNNKFFAGGGSPGKLMKTKNKSKMMKKSPNKMMKKKSPNMMMKKKKSPTMMMKKKSSMKMMKKKK